MTARGELETTKLADTGEGSHSPAKNTLSLTPPTLQDLVPIRTKVFAGIPPQTGREIPVVSVRSRAVQPGGITTHQRSSAESSTGETAAGHSGDRGNGNRRPPTDGEAGREGNGESRLLGPEHNLQSVYSEAIHLLGLNAVHMRGTREARSIFCMDEGLDSPTPSAIRVPGPVGLFYRTDTALSQLVKSGDIRVDKVFDHAECGALALHRTALGTSMDPDSVGEKLATRLAKKLTTNKGPYDDDITYGGQLLLKRRPSGQHTGQIIIIDGRANGLDPSWLRTMPPSFVISGILGEDAARDFANLAIDIALGDHGLGNALTPDTPLHLIGIAQERSGEGKMFDQLNLIRRSRGTNGQRIQTSVLLA